MTRRQDGLIDSGKLGAMTKGLGLLSVGLGAFELAAPGLIARSLGLSGFQRVVRGYGARELLAGAGTLSPMPQVGLWARVAGDMMDMATLAVALNPHNPKRRNATVAMAVVAGITVVDVVAAIAASRAAGRATPEHQDFSDRSGWPDEERAADDAALAAMTPPPDLRTVPDVEIATPS